MPDEQHTSIDIKWVIGTAFGVVLLALLPYFTAIWNYLSAKWSKNSEANEVFRREGYAGLVNLLTKQVDALTGKVVSLEEKNGVLQEAETKCRIEQASQRAALTIALSKIEDLEHKVHALQQSDGRVTHQTIVQPGAVNIDATKQEVANIVEQDQK